MVKQSFKIRQYWKVIAYYDVSYDLFHVIADVLKDIGFSNSDIDRIYSVMSTGRAKAVTCSSEENRTSIVLFNQHETRQDYLNSIVHEAEHIKQAVLKAYDVDDEGEAPAYTIGYIIGQMYKVFQSLICKC